MPRLRADLRRTPLRPSSEFAMHRAVYQHAPNAKAVVHTHADHCVALSTFRQPIPSFHYMINGFGGMGVPCVDPEMTPLLLQAQKRGCRISLGKSMLEHQAKRLERLLAL